MKTKGHEFMRNERLGYMCTCPTNLGTVVRCSAHIQLKVRLACSEQEQFTTGTIHHNKRKFQGQVGQESHNWKATVGTIRTSETQELELTAR